MRSGVALGLALIVSLVLAMALGGSVIARDLGERRLGFYFARPISGGAIWAGKLAAAAVLAVGAGVLVLLPASLFSGLPDPTGYWGSTLGPIAFARVRGLLRRAQCARGGFISELVRKYGPISTSDPGLLARSNRMIIRIIYCTFGQ